MSKLSLFAIAITALLQLPTNAAKAAWTPVPLSQLDVTEGASNVRELPSGLIEVTAPAFRATERGANSTTMAQLTFNYRGEVQNGQPTGGGDYRIQIGQKLLSANPCNLVYVMWRIYPTESIVVAVKRNPGSTSEKCGNEGYTNIIPDAFPARARSSVINVPVSLSARTGTIRTLYSSFNNRSKVLRITIGEQLIWQGRLPARLISGLEGPTGIRSDNGKFRFRALVNH